MALAQRKSQSRSYLTSSGKSAYKGTKAVLAEARIAQ